MRTKSLFFICSFLMVFSLVLAVQSNADDKTKKTVITVSEPMRIPGATLQPGKYLFKLVDSLSDRHIVRVTNEDETQVIATILAIPNYRLEVTGDSEFQMWEVPAGQPAALRAWFYPGDNFGQEFAYPKGEATTIATNVPTVSDEMAAKLSAQAKVEDPVSEEFRTTTITPAQTAQAEAQTQPAQPTTPTETAEEKAAREERERLERERLEAERLQREREAAAAAQAQQQAAPPQQPAQQPAEEEPMADELPATASPFPLIGLLGLLSVGASAAIRFARR